MRLNPVVSFAKLAVLFSFSVVTPALLAQTASPTPIKLFGPVDVRLSKSTTGYGTAADNFNSATLNLSCPASGITGVLSSSADGMGNLLVDNNINLTVSQGNNILVPTTNVCVGGANGNPYGPFQNCFSAGYESDAGAGTLTGDNPDDYAANDGIPPIDISASLSPGTIQVRIDLQDEGSGPGFYLAGSSAYLITNCSQLGVTGPAQVTGNPISTTNPTPQQLDQDFSFNPTTDQLIGFEYNLAPAEAAGTLAITDQTTPQVTDMPMSPASFPTFASGTSFATSTCLVHTGENLSDGTPACKLYTLECTVGTGGDATGAQCPVSSANNEVINDIFDGPAFTLTDIPTPAGPTFHQGIGLLMASEGWLGGPCTFDPAAQLTTLPCPQNLLTSFTGPGTYSGTARISHPNSTFISIYGVPEDLTTVTVVGQKPGGWINTTTASVTLSSQPPVLLGTTVPNAAAYVPAPIQSITYGITPAGSVPQPGTPANDTVLTNSSIVCPTLLAPTGIPAATFTPPVQTLTGLSDGSYLIHYLAQDCDGTQELKFTQDGTGSWTTNYYTFAINVDLDAPVVASGPTLLQTPAAPGGYTVGQSVFASYSCTDALSGVVKCGAVTTAPTMATGPLTSQVDTSSPGAKTFTVVAVDAAGNLSSTAQVQYTVVPASDSQIRFSISPTQATYPQATTASITVSPLPAATPAATTARNTPAAKPVIPTGTVQVLDRTKVIATAKLNGNGSAKITIPGLAAGAHSLSVAYLGDAHDPAGNSAPVTFTVMPAPVTLRAACGTFNIKKGTDFGCAIFADSVGGGASGVITYTYDGGAPTTHPLIFGFSALVISKPVVGSHTVVINYAAQGSYLAAQPLTETFTVK